MSYEGGDTKPAAAVYDTATSGGDGDGWRDGPERAWLRLDGNGVCLQRGVDGVDDDNVGVH